MVKLFSLVFIGGGLGSVARYGIVRILSQFPTSVFPFTTFGVNILGSFLIGLFLVIPAIADRNSYLCLFTRIYHIFRLFVGKLQPFETG